MTAIRRPRHVMHALDLHRWRAWLGWIVPRRQCEHPYCSLIASGTAYPHLAQPRIGTHTLGLGLAWLHVSHAATVRRNRHYCCAWDCPRRIDWLKASTGGIEDPGFAQCTRARTTGLDR